MKFLYSILFLILPINCFALIIETNDLQRIEQTIYQLDENSLVIFDVDATLIVANDSILSPKGWEYFKEFQSKYITPLSRAAVLNSISHLQARVSLVDRKILQIIDFLKLKTIKSIALTAIPTGKFGIIPNAEKWRVKQLNDLNIDFSWSFPSTQAIYFTQFTGKDAFPVFEQGILASAQHPKGEVLIKFLQYMQWKPSKVIFVDDQMDPIQSIESELSKQNIPVISFHYTGALEKSKKLDRDLADFQLNHLIENEQWLSDDEAKAKFETLSAPPCN